MKNKIIRNKKMINKIMKITAILIPLLCILIKVMTIRAEMHVSDLHAPKSTADSSKVNSTNNEAGYDARIGTVYYKTLNEAFDIAGRNDIIYLQRDVELKTFIDLYTDLNLTLASEPGEHYKITRSAEFIKFNNSYYLYDFLFHINCESFTINDVTLDGGAVWDEDGNNQGIASNRQLIVLFYGTLTLNNVTLQNNDNTADTPSDSYAGAVSTDIETTLIMNGGFIQDNRTAGSGGAISSKESSLIMNDVKILNNRAATGGAFYLWGGRIEITGSEVSKNTLTASDGLGGGIYSTNADIIIRRCQISKNSAYRGGGIFFKDGSCEIDGAYIEDNDAAGDGGAVYSSGMAGDNGSFLINNTSITGNYAKGLGGAVYHSCSSNLELSGDITIKSNGSKNIHLKNPSYPVIVKDAFSVSDRIGISVDEDKFKLYDVVVERSRAINNTEETDIRIETAALLDGFYSESSCYILKESGETLTLDIPQTTYEARIDSAYYHTLADAISEVKDGEIIYILKDIVRGEYCYYSKAKNYTIRSEPGALYQVKRGDDLTDSFLFYIVKDAAITLKDIIIDGGAVWSEEGSRRNENYGLKAAKALIRVNGTLYMETGTVIRNNHVDGFYPEYDGGGICIIYGTCYINGGEVTQNAVSTELWGYGAGINNTFGKLIINNGRITQNSIHTAQGGGGGISNFGSLVINGGIISDNISIDAKRVYYDGDPLNNHYDPIPQNNPYIHGGGIYSSNGNVILQGGEIVNNYTWGFGGGIYIEGDESHATIAGSRLNKNKAELNGGGIYVTDQSKLNLVSGEINYNLAGNGGGIYSSHCTIDYINTAIKHNEASTGSGVALDDCDLNIAQKINIYNNKYDDVSIFTSGRSIMLKEIVTFTEPLKISLSTDFKQGDVVVNGSDGYINPDLEDYQYVGDDFYFDKLDMNIIIAVKDIESDADKDLNEDLETKEEIETEKNKEETTDEKDDNESNNNAPDAGSESNEESKENKDNKDNSENKKDKENNLTTEGGTGSDEIETQDKDNGICEDKILDNKTDTEELNEADQIILNENSFDKEKDFTQEESIIDEENSSYDEDNLLLPMDDMDLSENKENEDNPSNDTSKDAEDIIQTGYHDFNIVNILIGIFVVLILLCMLLVIVKKKWGI